ncbi:MAG: hypothetical protein AMJ73_04425 [candidate division Zixibacteria bacterium SM1_73]|nr:MAG: hypothetical protein AMJ73_04425 [candidate division Zixibacteria bacterium SM1_73]
MQTQELVEALKEHVTCLDAEKIEKIDFDQMQEDLKNSIEALISLQRNKRLCEKLLADFKSEIKKMSLAISRAKGDVNASGLVERFLSSEDLSFEELVLLRDKVREDFNKSFPSRTQAKVVDSLEFGELKISEFKAGVKE